jgi:hypothetical protein
MRRWNPLDRFNEVVLDIIYIVAITLTPPVIGLSW